MINYCALNQDHAKHSLCCIDGTNLVRGSFGYEGPRFREQEDADALRLVLALEELCRVLGADVEMEIVFDGPERGGLKAGAASVTVRFSHELEADAIILGRVRAGVYANTGKVTVVTADAELGQQVSDEGGRWLKVRPGTALERVLGAIESRFQK